MSGTRILWGQIAAVLLIVVVGVWGATQWTAAALARTIHEATALGSSEHDLSVAG